MDYNFTGTIFSGTSNVNFSQRIANHLGTTLSKGKYKKICRAFMKLILLLTKVSEIKTVL